MNLHQIVSGAIGTVNPFVEASLQISTGYTTTPDGGRVPTYEPPVIVSCQVQPLQFNDITQLNGLNIQGIKRKIYVNGRWDGLVRDAKKGGDVITMANGDVYLVVLVLEYWPDWTSVAVTLQNSP